MILMNKAAIVTGIISFCGGWVAKCFYEKKTGRKMVQAVKDYKLTTENDGAKVNVKFANGDEMDIYSETVEVQNDVDCTDEFKDILNEYRAEEEEAKKAKKEGKPNPFPYVITDEQFEEKNGYKKRCLTFYSSDGALVDEEGEEIENWRELVGVDPLSKMEAFGEKMQLVRNEKLKEDYEITLIDDFYDKDDGR